MDNRRIKLSKLDAASRQLRTAITLWFNEADPVSIHALAFAAYEIFHMVSAHRDPNRRDLIFDSDWIKDEYRREWHKIVRREANFFKHADRDPEETIEFSPELAEYLILFAGCARSLCRHPQSEQETLFNWWIQISKPELLTPEGLRFIADHISPVRLRNLRTLNKQQFREVCYQAGLIKKRPVIEIV